LNTQKHRKTLLTKGNNVNKSELIDAIAASADLPKAAAGRALDATLEAVTEALTKGESVALVGFGTFTTKERAARDGRNPQTGATIQIAAATLPTFKPGKALKDAVNK
jgi:DNA-binding protein HU-beta